MNDNHNPEKAINYIRKMASEYAKAKANRVYLTEFRKSQKAMLINSAPPEFKTVQEKESYAYSHEDYLLNLKGLKEAVQIEESIKWQMVSAQAEFDTWRTREASSRQEHKNYGN